MSANADASPGAFSLIVTADDFGFGRATSAGIVRAHLEGPVTATSVMTVCREGLSESLPLLERAPRLELGLHLVLSGGLTPLTDLRGSGLVDRSGRLLGNGALWIRAWSGRINGNAVYEELCAQAEAFERAIGRPPAYVDAHHHAHQLPGVREALVRAVGEGVVPPVSRLSVESPAMRQVAGSRARRAAANLIGKQTRRLFAARGIWSNDWFFGMLSARELREAFPWQRQLAALAPQGLVEWIVHPGELDATLEGRDEYMQERVVELEALTDPGRRAYWERWRPYLTTKSKASAGV